MKKIKNDRKKAAAICFIFAVICVFTVGCSGKKDKNGSMKSEDGRSYGGIIKAETGEKVSTAFFDMTVERVFKYNTYQFEDGLYQADAGNTYLVATITIQNTYEKDLPMSITDFTLDYEGNTAESIIVGYGKTDLQQEDFMESIFTLKQGESITKSILFTVEDKTEYTLKYLEYYEDKFEGDSYEIHMNPEQQPDTTKSQEPGELGEDGTSEVPATQEETASETPVTQE